MSGELREEMLRDEGERAVLGLAFFVRMREMG
jgi:hypothetical protein